MLDRDTFEWAAAVARQGVAADGLGSWSVHKHVVGLLTQNRASLQVFLAKSCLSEVMSSKVVDC